MTSTTTPTDYEEICKGVHRIHRELSGTTIPELINEYIRENPKPTEKEVKKDKVITYPWEDCNEVTDERGNIK